ncbi:hypothetical protein TNIN_49361 [Trichonephila inaurata madagascariensis]|uniref:Uncharacterized protein n=1 Tax=Trichonephila inaurata madagascariensis TaxID=2747483 RepID=A0A8X7BR73_9ARAC|nr:hypothetical protein TNIN_49361 [Trichonephila inaurata madagascariensis]
MGLLLLFRNKTAVKVVGEAGGSVPRKEKSIVSIGKNNYKRLLDQLDAKIQEKRPGLKEKNEPSPEQHTGTKGCVDEGKTSGFWV